MAQLNSISDLRGRGFALIDPPVNILAYDPAGDGADNDALILASREEWRRGEMHDPDLAIEHIYRILLAHRMPSGIEFPDKVAIILRLDKQMKAWQRVGRAHASVIATETNGVGYAAASSIREKTSTPVLGYVTVGAAKTDQPFQAKNVAMPRLASLDNLRVMLELHKVKIAKGCEGGKNLLDELGSTVWARPGRPEALPGQRDDLVLALAGALWVGSKLIPPQAKQVKIDPKSGGRGRLTAGAIRIQ